MAKILEKEVSYSGAALSLVTTTETVVVTTPRVKIPVVTCRAVIRAWFQFTSGAGTTGITVGIRRGPLVTDPVVGERNTLTISTAAASSEEHGICVSEELQNQEGVEYSLTVAQFAATGNGTILQAAVEVEILNG